MSLGPEFGITVIMLFWIGGLSGVLAALCFVNLLGPMARRFSDGPLYPIIKGVAFAWAVGVLLTLLWQFDVLSTGFMQAAPLYAIVATTLGVTLGISGYRRRKDRDLLN